ncbi:MAG: PTS mannose transporter subunit IIA, partial [Eggerthellaceae bacterium]|nr:PTS mannose transporter subunit IIA [Eggerthellaceae bacterium]
GNICAITWFMLTNTGLVGPASPGSIIAFMMMSGNDWLNVAIGF